MSKGSTGTSMTIDAHIVYVDEKQEKKMSSFEKAKIQSELKKMVAINLNENSVFMLVGHMRKLQLNYSFGRVAKEVYTNAKNTYEQASILLQLYSACPGKKYIQTEMLESFKIYQNNVKNNINKTGKSFESFSFSEEQIGMIEDWRKRIDATHYISPEQKILDELAISASNIKLDIPDFDADTTLEYRIKTLKKLITKRQAEIKEEDEERTDRLNRIQSEKDRPTIEEIKRKEEKARNETLQAKRREEANRLIEEQKEEARLAEIKRLEKIEEKQFRSKYGNKYKFELDLKRLGENKAMIEAIKSISEILKVSNTESVANNELLRSIRLNKEHKNLYKEVEILEQAIYFIETAKQFKGIDVPVDIPDYTDIKTKIIISELVNNVNRVYKNMYQLANVLNTDKIKLWEWLNKGDIDPNSAYSIYTYGIPKEKSAEMAKEYAIIEPNMKLEASKIAEFRGEKAINFCRKFMISQIKYKNGQKEAKEAKEVYKRNREIKGMYDNYSKQINDELAEIGVGKTGKKAMEAWSDHKDELEKLTDSLELVRYDILAENFTMSFEKATQLVYNNILFNKLAEELWR